MRKFLWLTLALSLFTIPAHAQTTPISDVSASYSYFRLGGATGVNLNGFSTSGTYNANDWFGLAGDVGVYHGSVGGLGLTTVTYVFGPRFSYRASDRFVPYAQALFGASHVSTSFGATNPFTFSFGGGTEIAITSGGKFAVRPEVEYFGLRESGSTANSVRVSVAFVYHIGER